MNQNDAPILIVEDNVDLCRIYQMYLSLEGYKNIQIAHDGEEGLQIYKRASQFPELVIMDYRMPIKDGLEVTKQILQINPNQKIIFASADDRIKIVAQKLGIKDFLTKPFTFEQFLATISLALSRDTEYFEKTQ